MKKVITTICSVYVAFHAYAQSLTNDLSIRLETVKASGDAKQIISALPDAETLWAQNPKAYFEFMRASGFSLNAALGANTNAALQMRSMFTNILSKPISTNYQVALDTLEPQVKAAMSCSGTIKGSKEQKAALLVLSQLIGKIQDQIIPNYPTTAMMMSGASPQELESNNIANAKIYWQSALFHNRRQLIFLLSIECVDRSDTKFIDQIISTAHLDSDEAQKLRSGTPFF